MNRSWAKAVGEWVMVGTALVLSACGGGGGGSTPPTPVPPVVNVPPTANAGADQLVLVGATVNLNGSGTDTDGTIATLAWTQTGGTAVSLSATNTATPSFTAPAASAALVFEFVVTDNSGVTRSDTVTVNVNAPPVANAGNDQTVNAGASVTLQGTGSDANGTISSYAWTQTAGPVVTMTGASTATLTFTAPAVAAGLTFQLTVADNQQATHVDTITVTVNSLAAPAIVRHPGSPSAVEDGSALLFVVASGENLNYEWHSDQFGTIVKSGPEPFLLQGAVNGLEAYQDGYCYYVVVSNSAGSVTSNPGCLTVEDLTENLDPSDPELADRYDIADGYGNILFAVAQQGAGLLTGSTLFGGRTPIDRTAAPARGCLHSGGFLGTTLDGQALTTNTTLPLGQHTLSLIWDSCRDSPDDTDPRVGGMLVDYDFPTTWGVGSITMHLSGFGKGISVMNGTLQVTQTRSVNSSGRQVDEILIALAEEFSSGNFRKTSNSNNTIEVQRTLSADATAIEETEVDFDTILSVFDGNGFAGAAYQDSGGVMRLIFDPTGGDNGVPAHRSNSVFGVGIGSLPGGAAPALVTLLPSYGSEGWGFGVDYPEDPDEGD